LPPPQTPATIKPMPGKKPFKKFKKFFRLAFYQRILYGKRKISFLAIALILSLASILLPTFSILRYGLPFVLKLGKNLRLSVEQIYPEELEVTIKNGIVKTNVTEPYFITIKEKDLQNLFTKPEKQEETDAQEFRLLAIDTRGRAEDFERYQSLALLTETSLVYYSQEKINITPLRNIEDLTVNQGFIMEKLKFLDKKSLTPLLIGLLFVLPLFFLAFTFISKLLFFLVLSLPVILMVKIRSIPAHFSQVYRFTAAISFIPSLLWTVLAYVPAASQYLVGANALLYCLILGISYLAINKKPS